MPFHLICKHLEEKEICDSSIFLEPGLPASETFLSALGLVLASA